MSIPHSPHKTSKIKGIGGIFIVKRKIQTSVSSDVEVIIPTTAKEAQNISETINNQLIDSNTKFSNEVLSSNTINNDIEKIESKRKESSNNQKLPKKKKKISTMDVFKSNYFNN